MTRLPALPADKANHTLYGNAAALLGYVLARALHQPPAVGAALMTLAWAASKEIYDWTTGNGVPEWGDFVATVAGGLPVTYVAWRAEA